MNVGDLIYVKIPTYFADEATRGYLLQILEVLPEGYFVMVMEGPHIGAEHYVRGSAVQSIHTPTHDTYSW